VKGGPFAHSANERGEWHDLANIWGVAKLFRRFVVPFWTGDRARLAGLRRGPGGLKILPVRRTLHGSARYPPCGRAGAGVSAILSTPTRKGGKVTSEFEIAFEVAGPTAMFSRPDTGSTPISYPAPPYSAAKGMFEAVARRPHIEIHPVRVEICRPIRYERYVTNYGGPLRKQDQIRRNNNYQLAATVLVDVCYRVYAGLRLKQSTRGHARSEVRRRRRGLDWRPEFKRLFDERLNRGQTFYTPCLGWKEFVPSYFGPLRSGTQCDCSVSLVIPALLRSMWEHRQLKPTFVQDCEIVQGLMCYDQRRPPC
jgi:CRISPR-associated protein Cas5d